MSSPTALRDHLNLFGQSRAVLTLRQVAIVVGWSPPRPWTTAAFVGDGSRPTPFLRNLIAVLEDGWIMTPGERPGTIVFNRKGPPRAPSLVSTPPRRPTPTLNAFAEPPDDRAPTRALPRSARRFVTDPTASRHPTS